MYTVVQSIKRDAVFISNLYAVCFMSNVLKWRIAFLLGLCIVRIFMQMLFMSASERLLLVLAADLGSNKLESFILNCARSVVQGLTAQNYGSILQGCSSNSRQYGNQTPLTVHDMKPKNAFQTLSE